MKYYVVVEGRSTEKKVFRNWIPHINNRLVYSEDMTRLEDNCFLIISGDGYPQYLETVADSVADVLNREGPIRLVVCIDSEDMTKNDKFDELTSLIEAARQGVYLDYRVVVQHFCFETWALGHRKVGPRNPRGELLKSYRKIHNVLTADPELLPAHQEQGLNRSQFASKYLSLLFTDKNKNIKYSKANPQYVADPRYFDQLNLRLIDTGHISSFREFVLAFDGPASGVP